MPLSNKLVDWGLSGLAAVGRVHPMARRLMGEAEVVKNVSYGDGPCQQLDIYRPKGVDGPLPTMLYVHGGGFESGYAVSLKG